MPIRKKGRKSSSGEIPPPTTCKSCVGGGKRRKARATSWPPRSNERCYQQYVDAKRAQASLALKLRELSNCRATIGLCAVTATINPPGALT